MMNTLDTPKIKPLESRETDAPVNNLIIKGLDPEAAIAALESMYDGDEEEQRETWEYLRRVLDEDRLSDRKLFP